MGSQSEIFSRYRSLVVSNNQKPYATDAQKKLDKLEFVDFLIELSHLLIYQEPIPVESLVSMLCDLKQGYTQGGGFLYFLFLFRHKSNSFF